MNTREAMQALLDGKKIRLPGFNPGVYLYLAVDGNVRNQDGAIISLFGGRTVGFDLYEEPNPHTKGTFAWAREEAKRGRDVKSPLWKTSLSADRFAKCYFSLAEMDATDWQVVG